MFNIGTPKDFLNIIIVQIIFFWALNDLLKYFFTQSCHIFGSELRAKKHFHNFSEVFSINFFVFVDVENAEVNYKS